MYYAGFVIITLKDGSTVSGYFGEKSIAASDPEERDLYIEEVYTLGENNQWIKQNRTDGALITRESICHVEFFKTSDEIERSDTNEQEI